MRGYEKFNFDAFDAAHDFLWDQGFHAVSPADLDRIVDGWHPHPPDDLACDDGVKKRCMRRDLIVILDMDPSNGDAIFMLDGWEQSEGAKVELAVARFLGLRAIFQDKTEAICAK